MSKISGKEYALSKIFCKDFDYIIPAYQRPYSWEESQTETLMDNLYDFYKENPNDNYFLGSIVLIKDDNDTKSEVIDGQQRLTTLTILFSVIASKLNGKHKDNCIGYIMEPGNDIEGIVEKPRLRLRDKDQEFFKKYIQDIKIDDLFKTEISSLSNESQQHIYSNAMVINTKIEKWFSDEDSLFEFCKFLVQKCFIVAVCTTNQEAAFRIFSVMNSTGLDLSPTDIIKSEVIGKIPANNQQKYTDEWEDLEILTTRRGFADLFSHIRMIVVKAKAKKSLLEEFRENVVKINSPENLIENILKPYANNYSKIKNSNFKMHNKGNDKENEKVNIINNTLKWLNKIDNSDWLPSTIKFISDNKYSYDYIAWFLVKMERLTAYLNTVAKDVNERIERYALILKELETNKSSSLKEPIKSIELTEKEKSEFIKALDGEIYKMSSKRRNYIILRLDSFVSDGGVTYNPSILTIEHVLPQTVNPSSKWAENWSDENRVKWLNRIANLVPLTRRKNSEAQNYDFDVKKRKYFSGSNGTSSYALTSQIISMSEWTEKTVKDRQFALLKIFKEKWELQ